VVEVTSLGQRGHSPSTRFVFDLLAAPFRPKHLKTKNTSKTTHLSGSKGAVVDIRGRKGPWEASHLVFQPRHVVFLSVWKSGLETGKRLGLDRTKTD